MNLIEHIYNEMSADDADTEKQSDILACIYAEASPVEKLLLNTAFTCLCGWELSTLIDHVKGQS